MKTVTLGDVQKVAQDLITANGNTTTLEVKRELRNQGFFAIQNEVSSAMDYLNQSGILDFTNNGMWRTYYEKNTVPVKVTAASVYGTIKRIVKAKGSNSTIQVTLTSYTRRDGKVIESVNSGDPDIKFIVTSTASSETMYFPRRYTKDEVRQAFAKIQDVHFHTTRVSKV